MLTDYYRVVENSLASYNPDCVTAIQEGTKKLSSLLLQPAGRKTVYKLFRLCDVIDINNEDDVFNLFESLASNFAGVVQYNKDNRHETKHSGPRITIDLVCDIMLNDTLGEEIERLAKVNSLLLERGKEKCLDFKYDKMIDELRSIDWKSEVAEGGRQWFYQTCTEFGFFQTSTLNSTQQIFGNDFPTDFFLKQCVDIFGTDFNSNLTSEGIRTTNTIYGGLNIQADNVVYVHGSIDPWHVLGITKTLREGAPAIYIEGVYF